jgi:acetylornithine deacetylase/succinyl-diaminopimelate desuccinylase-like protein
MTGTGSNSRAAAIDRATAYFDDGGLFRDLARRVAIRSTAQEPEYRGELDGYLEREMRPVLEGMGYDVSIHANPDPRGGPFLIARRIEDESLPTVLTYGHGDVVRGQAGSWQQDRDPWTLEADGERWYGRGTADNKGQHSVNLGALAAVLAVRGRLGFNSTILLETSEEVGSHGLAEFAETERDRLSADLLLASDGPRLTPKVPSLFMGTRGALNFSLSIDLREGAHHSGNWGGLISNAGTRLANALACLVGPNGEIRPAALRPEAIPASVRAALAGVEIDGGPDAPAIEPEWGEPGLSPAERVFAWNSFEVLAFETGSPAKPVNAIPPSAKAWCQIRFTVDRDPETFLPAIRTHLAEHGFHDVQIEGGDVFMKATRLLPDHPWVVWAEKSIEKTVGRPPMIVPNLGGSLPNDVFADILDMPTVWVPHSYSACNQHAPNEHALAPILREGLQLMTGLFWDLGDPAGRPGLSRTD